MFFEYKKVFLPGIISIGIILCSMTACGQTSTSSNDRIEYLSMWNEGEPQALYIQKMAETFEEETGIAVEVSLLGRDILSKSRSQLMAGYPPELVEQDFNELSAAISMGTLNAIEISNMLFDDKGPEGQQRLIDIFGEEYIKLYAKKNRYYFFPYEIITSGFFYDETLFRQNGLTAPKTWIDFINVNTKLKQNGIAPLAADGTINFYNGYYFSWAVERVLGVGAFSKAAEGKTGQVWDDPGYLTSAEMVYQLSKAKYDFFQKDYQNYMWPTAQSEWAQGKYGSIFCSTWIPCETERYINKDFKYGFYTFPTVEGGKGKETDVEIGFIGCAIPTGAENITAAKSFLMFLSRKNNAELFCSMTKNISSRADVAYPEVLSAVAKQASKIITPYKMYDGVWAENPDWFTQVFFPLNDKLFFGLIEPQAFIEQIKVNSKNFWKNKE